jgi:hypothetical protein
MKAVIKADQYECPKQLSLVRERLSAHGIEPIFIASISDMPQVLERLKHEGDQPFLYLKSPWEWVDFPDQVIRLHCGNMGFENTSSESTGERLTYIPSKVFVHNETLLNYKEKFGKVYTFLVNVKKVVSKPNVEAPRIFITSHNRHQYLEMTLNSLFFSIGSSVPVTLLLNDATENVKAVARKVSRSNFEVLEIEKNCFYSSVNLAVQWYKPDSFIICEDDFILPQTAKEFYPDWEYHFIRRLSQVDMVGWSPSIDNAPSYHRFPRDRNPIGEWTHGGKKFNKYPLLLGNCLAVKLEFWKQALKKNPTQWHTPLDNTLHELAHSYSTPSLKGYHIGWNQQVDGFGSLLDRDFKPPMENRVTKWGSNKSRTMRLDAI